MQKKRNPFNFFLLTGFACLILFLFAGFAFFNYLKSPLNPKGELKAFVIQKGEGTLAIANRLEQEGIIKSAFAFKLALKQSNKVGEIEAGDFKLSSAMSNAEIINELSAGSIDKWVTLIEGLRVEEMGKKLSEELGIKNDEFVEVAKEGYMFPDTYLFNPEASLLDITLRMENNFKSKYTAELQAKIKKLGLTPDEGVILASIIEREGRSEQVRTEIAGVLLKRLNMGMKLDADATVQYAKDTQSYIANGGRIDKFWKPILRVDYTAVVSPYNTYLNSGLPPAPICNPSLASLNAVANANPNTSYLFYYHDSEGNSHYARTLEKHNENVATYP